MKIEFSDKEVCEAIEKSVRAMLVVSPVYKVTVELDSVYSRVIAVASIEKKEASDE